jgi:hypothetical protein
MMMVRFIFSFFLDIDFYIVHAPPKDFKAPTTPVSCGCSNHLDKLESEVELPVSAKQLYYLLFDDDNPNYIDIWEKKTVENKSKSKPSKKKKCVYSNDLYKDHL